MEGKTLQGLQCQWQWELWFGSQAQLQKLRFECFAWRDKELCKWIWRLYFVSSCNVFESSVTKVPHFVLDPSMKNLMSLCEGEVASVTTYQYDQLWKKVVNFLYLLYFSYNLNTISLFICSMEKNKKIKISNLFYFIT